MILERAVVGDIVDKLEALVDFASHRPEGTEELITSLRARLEEPEPKEEPLLSERESWPGAYDTHVHRVRRVQALLDMARLALDSQDPFAGTAFELPMTQVLREAVELIRDQENLLSSR